MASDFDQLCQKLRLDVALAREQGLSWDELEQRIALYYTDTETSDDHAEQQQVDTRSQPEQRQDDILFSDAPPDSISATAEQVTLSAWEWLSSLKDVEVVKTTNVDSFSAIQSRAGEKLVGSLDLLWHEIAGHGPDTVKIKGAEFTLLHEIAKAGASGISQPQLVKNSGQDKRSVPLRTDRLAKGGYITKVPVIMHAAKTSLLTLARYVMLGNEAAANATIVYYDKWWNDFVRILKANDNIKATEDLRTEMGVAGNRMFIRALSRCIRRLAIVGCARRVRARVAGRLAGEDGAYASCIQLLRDPTAADQMMFMPSKGAKDVLIDELKQEADQDDDLEDLDDDNNDSIETIDRVVNTEASIRALPPQWTSNLNIVNQIYDIVQSFGIRGMTTVDLHQLVAGPLWRRPIDERMIRLCDYWQTSQPPHLRHLGIIKDTALIGKHTQFNYRTYDNFGKAAENGIATWDAVKKPTRPVKGTKTVADVEPALDAWGFPVLPKALFAGQRRGVATLQQGAKTAPVATALSKRLQRHGPFRLSSDELYDMAPTLQRMLKRSALDGNLDDLQSPYQAYKRQKTGASNDTPLSMAAAAELERNNPTYRKSALISIDRPSIVTARFTYRAHLRGRRPKYILVTIHSSRLQELTCFEKSDESTPSQAPTAAEPTPRRARRARIAATEQVLEGFSVLNAGSRPAEESSLKQALLSSSANKSDLVDISRVHPQPQAVNAQTSGDYDVSITSDGLSQPPRDAIEEDDSPTASDTVHDMVDPSPSPIRSSLKKSRAPQLRKAGLNRASGSIQIKRTQIVMDLVAKCDGVFPGSRELAQATAFVLMHEHHTKTDIGTIMSTIKGLVLRNRLRKIIFQFQDAKDMPVQRAIIADTTVSPTDPKVRALQQSITEAWPGKYWPEVVGTNYIIANKERSNHSTPIKPTNHPSNEDTAPQSTKKVATDEIFVRRPGIAPDVDRELKLLIPPSDDEVSEPDEEQIERMTEFMVNDYNHDNSHAFLTFKSITRGQGRTTLQKFLGLKGRPTGFSEDSTSFLERSHALSSQLMLHAQQEVHQASGTYSTVAIITEQLYNRLRNGTARSISTYARPRPPIVRLQALGTAWQYPSRHRGTVSKLASKLHTLSEKPIREYKSMRGSPAAERESSPAVATQKRERGGPMKFDEGERLIFAIALFRVICGGMDKKLNWGVIAHMFSFTYEAEFLRRRWDLVRNAQESTIQEIMARLYKPFLSAYACGELPRVNFDDLKSTDWPSLLEWFEETILSSTTFQARNTIPALPRSMSEFRDSYAVTEPHTFWEHSRDEWFNMTVEKSRKDLMHEYVYATALPGTFRPTNLYAEDNIAVRSWIRAVAATPRDLYNAQEAAEILMQYPDDLIADLCEEMVANKTLRHLNKGRTQPGRNFELHDSVWAMFRRWPSGKTTEWQYLRDVASARRDILENIDLHGRFILSTDASDVYILALDNLVAHGLIGVKSELPARNDDFDAPAPKISALGYTDHSYNAKTLDRDKLRFPVVYEKTVAFTLEYNLVRDVDIPHGPPIDSREYDGRLPIWRSIHCALLPDIWDFVLRSLLHLLVFRPGITVQMIQRCHQHKFMVWEINLALDWMERSGIAVKCEGGNKVDGTWQGGWKTSDWWYCAFDIEMTPWKTA